MIIGVIAQNELDFKLNFPLQKINNIQYIRIHSEYCCRGVNLNGIVITDKASKNKDNSKLCTTVFLHQCICRK